MQELLASPQTRDLLQAQPAIHLEVKDDEGWFRVKFPEGVDELHFHTTGVIKDVERLKNLYDLFADILERLCKIGAATREDPGVAL